MLCRTLKVVVVPLLRVLAESDGGCVPKDDWVQSVEEATVPNQDDLPFDGCESDVLICQMLQAALVHDSVLLAAHQFVDCTCTHGHFCALFGAMDADEHGPPYRVACRPWRSAM